MLGFFYIEIKFVLLFIGTGGSCVYPLLSTSINKWKFLATEVDDTNYEYAVKNVYKNNFTELIKGELLRKFLFTYIL